MVYKIFYTKKALKNLETLPKKTAKMILDKIGFYSRQANPIEYAKKLIDPKYGTYRFRIGSYRAIFDIDNKGNIKILIILTIKHRKEIYKI